MQRRVRVLLLVCAGAVLRCGCYSGPWRPSAPFYHRRSYDGGYHYERPHDVDRRTPQEVMVDVVNDLGFKMLAIHNENNENNIAISPYGAISVLVALAEGLQGEAASEIQHAAQLPHDISIVRVGLRDIHRHLKSYFIPKEGFLAGLTLNHDNVTLNREYEDILKFYGFDADAFNISLYPEIYTTDTPEVTTQLKSEDMPSEDKEGGVSTSAAATATTEMATPLVASTTSITTTMKTPTETTLNMIDGSTNSEENTSSTESTEASAENTSSAESNSSTESTSFEPTRTTTVASSTTPPLLHVPSTLTTNDDASTEVVSTLSDSAVNTASAAYTATEKLISEATTPPTTTNVDLSSEEAIETTTRKRTTRQDSTEETEAVSTTTSIGPLTIESTTQKPTLPTIIMTDIITTTAVHSTVASTDLTTATSVSTESDVATSEVQDITQEVTPSTIQSSPQDSSTMIIHSTTQEVSTTNFQSTTQSTEITSTNFVGTTNAATEPEDMSTIQQYSTSTQNIDASTTDVGNSVTRYSEITSDDQENNSNMDYDDNGYSSTESGLGSTSMMGSENADGKITLESDNTPTTSASTTAEAANLTNSIELTTSAQTEYTDKSTTSVPNSEITITSTEVTTFAETSTANINTDTATVPGTTVEISTSGTTETSVDKFTKSESDTGSDTVSTAWMDENETPTTSSDTINEITSTDATGIDINVEDVLSTTESFLSGTIADEVEDVTVSSGEGNTENSQQLINDNRGFSDSTRFERGQGTSYSVENNYYVTPNYPEPRTSQNDNLDTAPNEIIIGDQSQGNSDEVRRFRDEDGSDKQVPNVTGTVESAKNNEISIDSAKFASEVTGTYRNDTNYYRQSRSVADYIIARYYDDQYDHGRRPYGPAVTADGPPSFLVNGRYREADVNFVEYDTVLPFAYLPHLNAMALRFPLDSTRYYLLLVLPLDETGIDKLICDLRLNTSLKYVIQSLQLAHVKATIPSFMLKGYVVLTPTLQKLGVRRVFEPRQADFTPLTNQTGVYVTNIEQAITVTIRNYMDPNSVPHYRNLQRYEPILFTADHPFLYFVIDADIHVTLMVGKINNPLNSRIR